MYICFLLQLKGDAKAALKKLNVIPSILEKLSLEGEKYYFKNRLNDRYVFVVGAVIFVLSVLERANVFTCWAMFNGYESNVSFPTINVSLPFKRIQLCMSLQHCASTLCQWI